MGIVRGPKITTDELIYGYDTGYGIADKNTSTRFYPGRPTTNVINFANDDLNNWASYTNGNDGTFTTEFGTVGVKINNRASWNGLYEFFTLPSTGTYTFSAFFRYRGGTSSNNGATVYISSYGGSDTATTLDKSKVNEWQRVTKTVNATDVTVYFYLISYGGSQSSDKSSWDVTMPQIEKLSDETPFVNGSRTNTTSLIDLKRSADINVSNLSFDGDSQPTFDGTDDHIETGLTRGDLGDTFTIVMYYKYDGTSGRTYSPIIGGHESGGGGTEFFIGKNSGNTNIGVQDGNYSGSFVTGSNAWDGNFHQMVYTFDRANASGEGKIYLDGVLKSTGTFSKCNTGENIRVGHEAESSGYRFIGDIPRVAIYRKVFTAAEVLEDFKAYKNRFNI